VERIAGDYVYQLISVAMITDGTTHDVVSSGANDREKARPLTIARFWTPSSVSGPESSLFSRRWQGCGSCGKRRSVVALSDDRAGPMVALE
jgi:hypothetical protein